MFDLDKDDGDGWSHTFAHLGTDYAAAYELVLKTIDPSKGEYIFEIVLAGEMDDWHPSDVGC